jgi:hypothetical protein
MNPKIGSHCNREQYHISAPVAQQLTALFKPPPIHDHLLYYDYYPQLRMIMYLPLTYLYCAETTYGFQGENIYHLDGPTKSMDRRYNTSTNFAFWLLGVLMYLADIFQHERNIIKSHIRVFLGMNTWMFETCRRQYN